MDTENDNDQLNSSSASSSNNSSSSNLLANLPMLPMLHSSINYDDELTADELQQQQHQQHEYNVVGAAASIASGQQHHQQQQQQPPPPPSQSQSPVPQLPDNSVFVSPLLFNNNSTPPPSSPSSSSSPPSSSHNLQFYHHQHSEHAHQQHSPTPSSHQQHALPPPPSPQLQEQTPFRYEERLEQDRQQQQQQQEQQRQQENTYGENTIADTIDATAVEGAVGDIDLNRGVASISQHQQQQEPSLPAPLQQLQQQQQHAEQLSVAGISLSLGEGVVATTSGERQQQTPPITLPLLLPVGNENEPDDDDDDDDDEAEEVDNGVREQEEAKPSISHSYSPHFTHSPFTHPLQHQQHHHHHHYPTFGGCSGNFTFDITGSSSSNGANAIANMLGSGSSSNNDKQTGSGGMALGGNNIIGGGGGSASSSHHHHHQHQVADRLKMLYPNVNENETPLPRCWSPHDKCLSIGLSQNNLRVHYKGVGKQHNEAAASVRTAHPIPPACGIYYFEVKIISKGKNGYMGIGLTAQQFRMNRLPGWDKQSYGYHGDDGNSFSSSGNGQSYGPTFTTGDIIGCCVNFVDNTCFYTKNGIHLGIAFRDLPTKLYPTVGLQTPGEEVDANFGQEPFKFDQMEDMMKQMRAEMKTEIYNFPMSPDQGDPTTLLHKMVSSYLLHNGYSQTAEAFARATGQTFQEDLSSIRIRQKILKLVMSGRMGQAIELTLRSYPGLLENNKNLWFMLKCRQFIEMVNGSDIEYCPTNNKLTNSITTQTQTTPPNQTSVIQSTKSYQNGKSTATHNAQTMVTTTTTSTTTTTNTTVINADNHPHQQDLKNTSTNDENCSITGDALSNSKNNTNIDYLNDVEMESNVHATNGNTCKNGSSNFNNSLDVDEEMDIDVSPSSQKYSHGIERILEFGKELSQMGQQLEKENKMNDEDRQMLEDAFSLIAYSNPWSSPLGWQLCPTKRENVCTALNSAILESMNYPRRPPLDVCVAHANELLKVMAHASLGACAFVNIEDVFPQN